MASKLNLTSTLPLSNSKYKIPQIGFGVYLSPQATCVKSCLTALRAGYRHIDTAQYYANETEVGQAVKDSKIARSDLFITTKILSPGKDVDSTYQSIEESVNKLGGNDGYVDLFLIHSPNGGKESRTLMWQALEKAKEKGIVRDIGVSNYGVGHIEEIKKIGKVWPPAVNQIEVSRNTRKVAHQAVLTMCTVAPVVPAARGGRLLQEEQHRCRGLLPHRSQSEGGRQDAQRHREQAQDIAQSGADPLLLGEGMGTAPQERHTRTNRKERRCVRFRAG